MAVPRSPFFDPGTHSAPYTLGILQLGRDRLVPTVLSAAPSDDYAEGQVVTTRFGTFPHSTLINQPWGTQILASVVDTGSRGAKSKKRKRERGEEDEEDAGTKPEEGSKVVAASSGFVHLIQPTPETWTMCLPHRTQVVYTPDYSYILQRLRARPGDHIIEAGAGSGSFTHAAARAVFSGYPGLERGVETTENGTTPPKKKKRQGKVYSFEYHESRAQQLISELNLHGLDSVVTVTHRDVYADGFCLPASEGDTPDDSEPNADVIFLDLPAPWLALKHLTRSPPPASATNDSHPATPNAQSTSSDSPATPASFRSPLNPKSTTRICTFSPCIEQVQKTISALRSYGWVEIGMVEIQARRLEVRRERVGLNEEGVRGANITAATVDEAVQKLRDVEDRAKIFHGMQAEKQKEVMRRAERQKRIQAGLKVEDEDDVTKEGEDDKEEATKKGKSNLPASRHDRLNQARANMATRPAYKEGRLIHRTEPEIKTHTSYLTFAVLPREWIEEDEERARRKWK